MPLYVSKGTASIGVSINGTPVDPTTISGACFTGTSSAYSCNISFPAPPGSDAFDIALGDANGDLLSEGSVTAGITAGQTTVLHLTFFGLPAYVQLKFDNPNPPVGAPADVHLSANAYDASGNLIIGDNYLQPILISDNDTTRHTTISGTQLTSPGSSLAVHYDGKLMSIPATFTASSPGSAQNVAATFLGNAYQTFATSYSVNSVAKGTDGNVWFTECGSSTSTACKVGYVTPVGQVVETPDLQEAQQIASGPDGNMWFTEADTGYVDKITPQLQITRYQVATLASNQKYYSGPIVTGPDGNLWFAEGNDLAQMDTSGQVLNRITLACAWCDPDPGQIIVAANNTFWLSETWALSNVTMAGAVTNYSLSLPRATGEPSTVAVPNGNVDFNFDFTDVPQMYSIAPNGTITTIPFSLNVSSFTTLTLGPDGNVWGNALVGYGSANTSSGIASFNESTGAFVVYPMAVATGAGPSAVWGADGNLWLSSAQYGTTYGITRFRYNP